MVRKYVNVKRALGMFPIRNTYACSIFSILCIVVMTTRSAETEKDFGAELVPNMEAVDVIISSVKGTAVSAEESAYLSNYYAAHATAFNMISANGQIPMVVGSVEDYVEMPDANFKDGELLFEGRSYAVSPRFGNQSVKTFKRAYYIADDILKVKLAIYTMPYYVRSSNVEVNQKMFDDFKRRKFVKPLAMGKGTKQAKILDAMQDLLSYIASEYYRYGKDQKRILEMAKQINVHYKNSSSFGKDVSFVSRPIKGKVTFYESFLELISQLDDVKAKEHAEWCRLFPEKAADLRRSESILASKINTMRKIALKKAERDRLEDRIRSVEQTAAAATAAAAKAKQDADAAWAAARDAEERAGDAQRRANNAEFRARLGF